MASFSLRKLLIDCRIALRHAGVQQPALLEQLEQAIQQGLSESNEPAYSPSAHRVALAWQTAARQLKFSNPTVHAELNRKVLELLELAELKDPGEEIESLRKECERLGRELAWQEAEYARKAEELEQLRAELAALREALFAAVPDVTGKSPQERALRCIEQLARGGRRAPARSDWSEARQEEAIEGTAPSRIVVEAVAAGRRKFTDLEREWCVTEAMCLTGWQYTPLELLDKGDAWIAKLLLEKGSVR
ncbi:MAG: hypothetical protein KatS3mg125_2036 [Lysobacterales bacterium]|jgi:hypothetical protein|nr:MAG: hypothetical protein KatS3mg125_2036 [Xanthomonadales bacterium]